MLTAIVRLLKEKNPAMVPVYAFYRYAYSIDGELQFKFNFSSVWYLVF